MQLSFQPIGEQKRGVCVPFGKKKTTRKENDDDDDARSVSKRRRRRCFSVGISFLGRRSKEMQSLLRGRFCGNT